MGRPLPPSSVIAVRAGLIPCVSSIYPVTSVLLRNGWNGRSLQGQPCDAMPVEKYQSPISYSCWLLSPLYTCPEVIFCMKSLYLILSCCMSLWRAWKLCACVFVSRRSSSRTVRQRARSANVGVGVSVDHVDYQNFKLLHLSDHAQEDSLTVGAQGMPYTSAENRTF